MRGGGGLSEAFIFSALLTAAAEVTEAYCAVSGECAVGQCADSSLQSVVCVCVPLYAIFVYDAFSTQQQSSAAVDLKQAEMD